MIKMNFCLSMVLSDQDRNVTGFLCYGHNNGLGLEKEGKLHQYIVKTGVINLIVSNISGSRICSLAVVVFIRCSIPLSCSVVPSY